MTIGICDNNFNHWVLYKCHNNVIKCSGDGSIESQSPMFETIQYYAHNKYSINVQLNLNESKYIFKGDDMMKEGNIVRRDGLYYRLCVIFNSTNARISNQFMDLYA